MIKYVEEKNFKLIFLVTLIVIVGATGGYFVYKTVAGKKEIRNVLAATVNRANAACPVRLSASLQIDSAFVLSERTLQYDCTLLNMEKGEVSVGALKQYLAPEIKYWVSSNPIAPYLAKNKIVLVYSISDKNGEFIYKLSISSYNVEKSDDL